MILEIQGPSIGESVKDKDLSLSNKHLKSLGIKALKQQINGQNKVSEGKQSEPSIVLVFFP